MTWIKTVPLAEVDDKLRSAMEGQRALYPVEYATPVHPDESGGSIDCGVALADSAGAVSRVWNIRGADVAGVAAEPAAA